MARQPDIQYVRFYTDGSAARKIELTPRKKKNDIAIPHRPRVRREKKTVIHVDPLCLSAMLVAGVMLIVMLVGMMRLGDVNAKADTMADYVSLLRSDNTALQEEYKSGYDLKDVEQKALEMGLVPIDQVEHVTIELPETPVEEEPTFWENVGAFFAELFGA